MKGFNFKLQKLLDMRIDKEEYSKREFREAQRQKLELENRLNMLKGNYKKYSKIENGESVIERKIKHSYLNSLNFSMNETTDEICKAEKVVEEKRIDLKQRQIDRKTVEILKEKQLSSFIKEQEAIEQKANDEFALYAFMRTLAEKGGE